MKEKHLSIIVTTENGAEGLEPLFIQGDSDSELIIIDSHYSDKTKKYLESKLGIYERIVYAPVKISPFQYQRNLVQSLNTGFLYSENEWIVRADNNLEFKPDFFRIVRENIKSFNDTVGTNRFTIIGQKLWKGLGQKKWNDCYVTDNPARFVSVDNPSFPSSFSIYPISLIHILNGYDERYDRGFEFEDIQFLHRSLIAGYKIFYDKQMMAFSHQPNYQFHNIHSTRTLYEYDIPEINCGKIHAYNYFNLKEAQSFWVTKGKFEVTVALPEGECSPEWYDKTTKEEGGWGGECPFDDYIKKIIEEKYPASIRSNMELVDLGCGIGRTLKVLEELGMHMIGIDFSKEALKIAKEETSGVKFLNCDMRKTPIEDKSIDIVLSFGANEHHKKIDFSESRRIIKKDGIFLCTVPAHYTHLGWTRKGKDSQWEWLLTRNEWITKLEKAGFDVDKELINEWLFVCYPK